MTALTDRIVEVVNSANLGQPTARKSGRTDRWPYVPVIDHGTHVEQIRGLAYATRPEAMYAAERHLDQARATLARHLAEPRYRALREQYGLPREIDSSPDGADSDIM